MALIAFATSEGSGELVHMNCLARAFDAYKKHERIQRGGAGGPDPAPEKSQKYWVSEQYWSGSPEKIQSCQASIQCRAIIGTPAKRNLNDVSLAGR